MDWKQVRLVLRAACSGCLGSSTVLASLHHSWFYAALAFTSAAVWIVLFRIFLKETWPPLERQTE